jgi:hypothetical protein
MTDTETVLEFDEAERIAGELVDKYGDDALDFVRSRAERARSVGDDLAYEAWRAVMAATRALRAQKPLAAD